MASFRDHHPIPLMFQSLTVVSDYNQVKQNTSSYLFPKAKV